MLPFPRGRRSRLPTPRMPRSPASRAASPRGPITSPRPLTQSNNDAFSLHKPKWLPSGNREAARNMPMVGWTGASRTEGSPPAHPSLIEALSESSLESMDWTTPRFESVVSRSTKQRKRGRTEEETGGRPWGNIPQRHVAKRGFHLCPEPRAGVVNQNRTAMATTALSAPRKPIR